MNIEDIKIKTFRIWYAIGSLLLIFIILWILSIIKNILALIIICTLLSYLMMPIVNFFSGPINIQIRDKLKIFKWTIKLPAAGKKIKTKKGLPRIWAITLTFVLFFMLILAVILLVIPLVSQELNNLYANRLVYRDAISEFYNSSLNFLETHTPMTIKPYIKSLTEQVNIIDVHETLKNAISSLMPAMQNFMTSMSYLLLIPFVTFYILMDYEVYRDGLISLIPKTRKKEALELLYDLDVMLKQYIRGQLLVCLIIGVSVTIAMIILDIPYAILFGAFAGAIDVIPYIGVILSLIPAVLFALMKSPLYALLVLAILYFIHWFEGHVIIPNIMGQSVKLPPLTVIVALIIGAEIMGLLGMFLAVPVAAIIRVCIDFHVKKRIEKENAAPL